MQFFFFPRRTSNPSAYLLQWTFFAVQLAELTRIGHLSWFFFLLDMANMKFVNLFVWFTELNKDKTEYLEYISNGMLLKQLIASFRRLKHLITHKTNCSLSQMVNNQWKLFCTSYFAQGSLRAGAMQRQNIKDSLISKAVLMPRCYISPDVTKQ